MMEEGLLDEVKRLLSMGIRRGSTAMQAIGYKELVEYLDGECDLESAIDKIKQESRRYAKRQMTWFRRNKNINWLTRTPETAPEEILRQARQLLIDTDK